MNEIFRISVFVGGEDGFEEKKKDIRTIVKENFPDRSKSIFDVGPKRIISQRQNFQQQLNEEVKSADLLLFFFANSLGTVTEEIKRRLEAEPLRPYWEIFAKVKTLKNNGASASIEELITAISSKREKGIYVFFRKINPDQKKPEIEGLKQVLGDILPEYLYINYEEKDFKKRVSEILKDQYKLVDECYRMKEKPSSFKVYPDANGTSPYVAMTEMLSGTTYLLSFNMRADLPDPSIAGPRQEFSKAMKKHSDLHFTRIVSFPTIKKFQQLISEIQERMSSFNLLYYPFLHSIQSGTFTDEKQAKVSLAKMSEGLHVNKRDGEEEMHPSLVLFGREEATPYKYQGGVWGLFGDTNQDGNGSVAFLFNDSQYFRPIEMYAKGLKTYLSVQSPLFISFSNLGFHNLNYKKYYEGLYVSNVVILLEMLKRKFALEEKVYTKIKSDICILCQQANKDNFRIRTDLSPLFDMVCQKLLSINYDKISCLNCENIN